MADELTIKVSAKLDESSVSGIQSQLDGLSKNNKNKIQIQVDNRAVTDSIKSIQNSLNQLTSKPYRIELQIDQSIISNINSITNSLNQAVNNVQRSIGQQLSNIRTSPVSGNYTGVSKVIQRGKVDEINGFEATSEIEKRNLALGETLTIYKELKKEEDDEIGRMEETSRQYETNYELQAKAAAKAHEQAIQEEARYRTYIEKENAKAQKEQEALARQQQQQQAKAQKDRERSSSMYAGMFQQIDTKEQKERDKVAKEEQKRQEDYTKLHIQARQKQAKEDERLAKEEQKRNDTYDKLFAEAERKRLQQEADAKKASEQQYLSDLKKNSKQLEFEQKTSANAESLIANAQNELKLLEKSTFSGSKALTGDYADKARAEIAKVSEEFDKLKEAAGKSFSDAMNVSKDGLTASLKNLGAELDKLKGLQYPADKLAAKDVDTLKLDYGNKIQEFREQLKGAGLETSDFATKLGDLEKGLQTVGKVDGSGTVWADWKAQFESLQASYEKFQASASGKGLKLAESINIKQLGQVQDLITTLNNSTISGAGTEALKEELYSLETEYSNLMAQLQSGNLTTDQFNALSNGVKELDDRLKQAASSAKVLQDGFKNEQSIHKFQNNVDGLRNNFEKLERTYANIIENNPEIAAKFEQLRAMFEQGQVDPINYAQVASDVSSLGKACSNAAGEASGLRGALEGAFGGVGQYLARFTSAFYIINKSIQTVKSMVNEVTQLDTSLMELQKVTTLSGDSLAQFTDNAYKTGKEVGRTGKDVIDAVTTFSRAGYNLEESNQLAKAALTMTNVGVDIPSTEAAASDMISILKAFDKQADESMQVIDELYNVANKEPLDFGNITQMLVTAGGTLAQTNTSLEETMGLLTGGFATLRDTSVANGLVMISQRLRGVKEDGEAIEEEGFMPKLKKAFGDVGISIEDQNGELRSTYDILNDLAGVWDQLSSKQRQYLGEKAAGNRQVKTLNAIMANWDVVQDTIQKANEATGEATKGNEKYLDSIEGRITQFKSAFSDLARTTIDSDLVKGIVGFGTGVLNVTKDLGGLVPVLTTISGIIIALKGAKIAEGIGKVGEAILKIGPALKGIVTGLTGAAGASAMLGSFITILGLATAAFVAFQNVKVDLSDKFAKASSNYSEQQSKLDSINQEIEKTKSLMEELDSKGPLTIVEQDQYDSLKKTNDELERQKKIQEEQVRIAEREARESAVDLYNGKRKSSKEEESGVLGAFKSKSYTPSIGLYETLGEDSRYMQKVTNVLSSKVYTYEDLIEDTLSALPKQQQELAKAQTEYDKVIDEGIFGLEDPRYLTAKANLDKWQDYVNESEDIINKAIDEVNNIIGDKSRITNPANEIEREWNAIFDYRDRLYDMLLTGADVRKSQQSNYILNYYKEQVEEVQKYIKESGELTEEVLMESFPDLAKAFADKGWDNSEIVRHLNEIYKVKPDDSAKEYIKSINELIENNYLASDSYKALSTAMTEQQKSGTISMETYQKLIESDEKLANALTLTADGYAINSDAVNEYVQAKTDEQKVQALLAYDEQNQKLEELKKRYEELSNATIKTDDVIKELAQNQDAQNAAERDMEAIAAYVRELDAATSALTRFKAAQSSANEDANFQDSKKVYEVLKEGNKTGKRNTDDFRTAADYVLGDNWKENLDQFGGSVEKAYQHAEKVAKRYSGQKDEKTAAKNFMKDVADAGFGTYDKKSGSLELNEGVTLDDMAAKMGIAKGYLADMFKLLNTYANEGEGFTFPELFTDDEKKQAEDRKKALEENEKAQEQMGDKVAAVEKDIEAANERGDDKEAQRLEQQKKRYENAQKVLEQEHTNIENGVEMDIDTMTLEDAKKKIDELYETISTLNGTGIDIPVTIADSYNTLLETFPQLRGELQNPLPPINVKMTGDALPKLVLVDGKVKQLEGDHFVDVDVNDNETTDDVKSKVEDVENGTYSAKVDAELGNDTATGDIQTIENGPYDTSIDVKQIGAESAGAQIDSVANKERTATIKVKYSTENDKVGELKEEQIGENGVVTEFTQEQIDRWQSQEGNQNTLPFIVADPIQVPVEASKDSVDNIGSQVQDGINKKEVEFDPNLNVDEWNLFGENGDTGTVDVQTEASNPEEPIQQVQEAANATPIEMTFSARDSVNAGSAMNSLIDKATKAGVDNSDGGKAAIADLRNAYVQLSKAREKAESVDIGDEAGAAQAASDLQSAASSFMTAYNNLSTITNNLSIEPIEVDANTDAALKKVQAIADNGVTVSVKANTSSAESSIEALSNKTVTITVQANTPEFAKGTRNAPNGMSLVDEKGAELIEHTRQGTYELGTNNGPRLTNLEKGDVVHTASETNRILSRMAKVGGFFRNGLNQAKTIFGNAFATGVSGKVSGLNSSSSSKKKPSSKKSSSKKSSSKSSKVNMKKLQAWAEKLFDWAEIRLERLQTITDEWIYKAGQAIGYAAQNTQLANAMKSVENQIKDTTAAYNLYIAQADKVAKKTKLSADIINRIQNGTIEISSYDKNTQQKIQFYKEWLNFSCHFE